MAGNGGGINTNLADEKQRSSIGFAAWRLWPMAGMAAKGVNRRYNNLVGEPYRLWLWRRSAGARQYRLMRKRRINQKYGGGLNGQLVASAQRNRKRISESWLIWPGWRRQASGQCLASLSASSAAEWLAKKARKCNRESRVAQAASHRKWRRKLAALKMALSARSSGYQNIETAWQLRHRSVSAKRQNGSSVAPQSGGSAHVRSAKNSWHGAGGERQRRGVMWL